MKRRKFSKKRRSSKRRSSSRPKLRQRIGVRM